MNTAEVKKSTCRERIREHLTSRVSDLRRLWKAYQTGDDDGVPDLGNIYEYGLSFDYVAAGTFKDQREGYFRYQISWGGPSDEFRFFTDAQRQVTRIEYWFLDWFDGAKVTLHGKREAFLLELFAWFDECGAVEAEFRKATEE